jgi:uncharacterized protein involved in exopolysaccharide biosynthesis
MKQSTSAFDLSNYWRVFARRWKLLVCPLLVLPVLFVASGFTQKKVYRSVTKLYVRSEIGPVSDVTVTVDLPRQLNGIMEAVRGPATMQKIAEKLHAQWPRKGSAADIVEDFEDFLEIGSGGEHIVQITYMGQPLDYTFDVVNAFAEAFQEEGRRIVQTGLEGKRNFLDLELRKLDAKIRKLQTEEARLKKDLFAGSGEDPDSTPLETLQTSVTERLGEAETQMRKASMDLQAAIAREARLTAQIEATPKMISVEEAPETNPLVTTLTARIADLEGQLAKSRATYTDRHPEVEQIRLELTKTRQRLAEVEAAARAQPKITMEENTAYSKSYEGLVTAQGETAALRSQQAQWQIEVGRLRTLARKIPQYEQRLLAATTERQAALERHEQFTKNLEEVKGQIEYERSQETQRFTVIPPNELDPKPVNMSKKRRAVLGGALGFITGTMLIMLLEYLDHSIRSPHDLRRYVDADILAVLPKM